MSNFVLRFLAAGIALLIVSPLDLVAQSDYSRAAKPTALEPTKKTDAAVDTSLYTSGHPGHVYAEIETSKGTIEVELDFKLSPLTAMNFVGLAEGTLPFQNRPAGKPFYDGQTFHRVVDGFVIQGGDPSSADPSFPVDKLGDGGPGYSFPDEFSPGLRHDAAGVVSMANDGPDTNGSQFFITLAPVNRLNYLHSVFGQVVRGLDVVKRISPGDRIIHVKIQRTGEEAEAFQAEAERFKTLQAGVATKPKPTLPEGVAYFLDDTKQLPEFRVKNFNYKLANYEQATGHRIVVHVLAEFSPETPDQTMGNLVKKLAAAAGVSDQGEGVCCGCFVSQKTWSVRLGEATYPALLDSEGSTQDLMAKGILQNKKSALCAAANELLKDGKLKESVDAMIDLLILKLDDHALSRKPAGT